MEERFAHSYARVHHERDEFLVHRCGRDLALVVLLSPAFRDGVVVGDRVSLAASWLTCVVGMSLTHNVGVGDVEEDGDAGSRRPSSRMSGCRLVVVPSGLVVPGISLMGSVKMVSPVSLQAT